MTALDIPQLSRAALAVLPANHALTIAARNAVLLDQPANRGRVAGLLKDMAAYQPEPYKRLMDTYETMVMAEEIVG